MTWVWGLGPELLQVKRRLPAGRWGPVFRLTDPGKREEVGLFLLFNSTGDYLPIDLLGTE